MQPKAVVTSCRWAARLADSPFWYRIHAFAPPGSPLLWESLSYKHDYLQKGHGGGHGSRLNSCCGAVQRGR